jgi:UDP-N-acetylglucosamine 2-epimerase (non-hydrolysing)
MLDQVLDFFEITPDYLDLIRTNQNLYSLTSDIILGLKPVLEEFQPDYVYVHGDTTLLWHQVWLFLLGSKVCHVEAGLRTRQAFPSRKLIGKYRRIADFHFRPRSRLKKIY